MTKLYLIFLLAALAASNSYANPYQDADWELISDEDGVEVYSAEIEGSDIKGVKGVFTMPYNCAYVFSVIMDHRRSIHWVDRLISSEVIEEKSPGSVVSPELLLPPLLSQPLLLPPLLLFQL